MKYYDESNGKYREWSDLPIETQARGVRICERVCKELTPELAYMMANFLSIAPDWYNDDDPTLREWAEKLLKA